MRSLAVEYMKTYHCEKVGKIICFPKVIADEQSRIYLALSVRRDTDLLDNLDAYHNERHNLKGKPTAVKNEKFYNEEVRTRQDIGHHKLT